jgi:hypothetical protein
VVIGRQVSALLYFTTAGRCVRGSKHGRRSLCGPSWTRKRNFRIATALAFSVLYCEGSETGLKEGVKASLRTLACLPALTTSSGMRYRLVFRLSCGCPPDGTRRSGSHRPHRPGSAKRFC